MNPGAWQRAGMRLENGVVEAITHRQAGAARTAQLVAAGADTAWISRQVRSGRWQRLHQGVVVTYSGPLTWLSRAWGALLYAGPGAALSHESAAFRQDLTSTAPRVIDVTIPASRRVRPSRGLRIHHRRGQLLASGRPRTTWRGDTVVDLVAAARSVDDAVGWVCRGARAGASPPEIADAVARRRPFRNSGLLTEIVAEVQAGIESPLERRYHRDVERAHGLPRARLQVRAVVRGLWIRADGIYDGYGTRVELDGDLGHPGGRTDADSWRDNAVLLATTDRTLRYRWRHTTVTACATAAQVAQVLTLGGWHGRVRRCSPFCTVLATPQDGRV